MQNFCIMIAGVPVRVVCRHEENRKFLKEYETDRAPVLSVEPKDSDISNVKEGFLRIAEAGKQPIRPYADAFLENNAIHALLAEKLVEYGVLLLHGSALCMDGEAYLFVAPSGTGKSTHAKLWREVFGERIWMINDDKPMLSVGADSRVIVWGSPWDGKHHLSRNAGAPLRAIVDLHRDVSNHIELMRKNEAFPVLMRQEYYSEDPAVNMRIIEMKIQLLNKVNFYRLGCNMEPEAAKTAREGMESYERNSLKK